MSSLQIKNAVLPPSRAKISFKSKTTTCILNAAFLLQFAVCLPFETEGALSLTYVVFLMLINGVAFSILMGCYLKAGNSAYCLNSQSNNTYCIEGQSPVVFFKVGTFCSPFSALGIARAHIEVYLRRRGCYIFEDLSLF